MDRVAKDLAVKRSEVNQSSRQTSNDLGWGWVGNTGVPVGRGGGGGAVVGNCGTGVREPVFPNLPHS